MRLPRRFRDKWRSCGPIVSPLPVPLFLEERRAETARLAERQKSPRNILEIRESNLGVESANESLNYSITGGRARGETASSIYND